MTAIPPDLPPAAVAFLRRLQEEQAVEEEKQYQRDMHRRQQRLIQIALDGSEAKKSFIFFVAMVVVQFIVLIGFPFLFHVGRYSLAFMAWGFVIIDAFLAYHMYLAVRRRCLVFEAAAKGADALETVDLNLYHCQCCGLQWTD